MKELYRFRQFLAEGVIKENIMVSPIIMFGGKKYIEDVISSPDDFGFDKDDAEWVKNNILSSPKRVSIQDYMDLDDKWVKQAQIDTSGGGALDHVVDGLKIHVKQELITPEQEKEAMKVVGLSEGVVKEEDIAEMAYERDSVEDIVKRIKPILANHPQLKKQEDPEQYLIDFVTKRKRFINKNEAPIGKDKFARNIGTMPYDKYIKLQFNEYIYSTTP